MSASDFVQQLRTSLQEIIGDNGTKVENIATKVESLRRKFLGQDDARKGDPSGWVLMRGSRKELTLGAAFFVLRYLISLPLTSNDIVSFKVAVKKKYSSRTTNLHVRRMVGRRYRCKY